LEILAKDGIDFQHLSKLRLGYEGLANVANDLAPETVSYRIIAYQFPVLISGRSHENLCSAQISNKKMANNGRYRQLKAKENP
jgi:hypothetical protein